MATYWMGSNVYIDLLQRVWISGNWIKGVLTHIKVIKTGRAVMDLLHKSLFEKVRVVKINNMHISMRFKYVIHMTEKE